MDIDYNHRINDHTTRLTLYDFPSHLGQVTPVPTVIGLVFLHSEIRTRKELTIATKFIYIWCYDQSSHVSSSHRCNFNAIPASSHLLALCLNTSLEIRQAFR